MATQGMQYMDYSTEHSFLVKSKEFLSLKTGRDRIKFILKFVRPLHQFRADISKKANSHLSQHMKNTITAQDFIQQGIKSYQKRFFTNAILMFTKAILSAPIPLETKVSELSVAYSHKSLAEFELKDYESALSSAINSLELFETIEMHSQRIHCLILLKRFTESLQCVDDLIVKCQTNNRLRLKSQYLGDLKRYIVHQMSDLNHLSEAKSSNSTHSLKTSTEDFVNVWLHPSYQITSTERKGRYPVAKQLIHKGTIVLLEQPFSTFLNEEAKTKLCGNCYKSIGTSLWPCIGCDEVIFCDKRCFITAYDDYHQYECGISGLISSRLGSSCAHTYCIISRAGIRTAFECEEQNNINFESYVEFKRQQIGNNANDCLREHFETEFKAYYSLMYHNSNANISSTIFNCYKAIDLALLFDYSRQLDFDIEVDFEKFVTLADICLKDANRISTNVFGWSQPKEFNFSEGRAGSCFCNIASLINHNCMPNISWGFKDHQLFFKTNRNINAGEEICITYGPTADKVTFCDRQKKLKSHYLFDCNCEACLRDCKNILCVRCNQCSGPVAYFEGLTQLDQTCLECGQPFKANLKRIVSRIYKLKKKFNELMKHLENTETSDDSLIEAQNILKELVSLVYSKSKPLRDYFKQLIDAFVRYERFAEAVQCIDYFTAAIDLKYDTNDDISAQNIEDLLLLTNCYYEYLNTNEVTNEEDWNNCFELYSKLIECLKKGKKASKERAATDPQMQDITGQLRLVIQEKKGELTDLKGYYECIAKQKLQN